MGFDSRSGVNKIYSAELSYTLCVLSEVSAIGLPDKTLPVGTTFINTVAWS